MRLYVDGVQVAVDPSAPTNSFFTGRLDEAAFYTTTLSPAQVLAHFQANNPAP